VVSALAGKLLYAYRASWALTAGYMLNHAMDTACAHGNKSIVQCLARAKARVDQKTRDSPLFHAVSNGHTGVVQYLLRSKASLNSPIGDFNETPLQFAIRRQHTSVVPLLERASASEMKSNKK
jgi:ankyrin repeat protein